MASVIKKMEKSSSAAYATGLDNLDDLIGGLIKQDLILIAARASMGKYSSYSTKACSLFFC